MYVRVAMCTSECRCLCSPEEDIRSLELKLQESVRHVIEFWEKKCSYL